MDDESWEEEPELVGGRAIPARRARPLDFFVLFLCLIHQIAEAFTTVLDHTVGVLAAHANYDAEQREFADAIRADIETITSTEEA